MAEVMWCREVLLSGSSLFLSVPLGCDLFPFRPGWSLARCPDGFPGVIALFAGRAENVLPCHLWSERAGGVSGIVVTVASAAPGRAGAVVCGMIGAGTAGAALIATACSG